MSSILLALLFVSGAAGLVFEIVWFYRCSLVFGSNVWAASITLSSFMGGLAIGNGVVGRYGHRIRRPLLAYAAAEFVVACAGVGLVYALSNPAWFFPLSTSVIGHFWQINLLRLVTTFTALLVPATAMGATLPLLVGEMSRRHRGFGVVLGRAYGWNTLGAVCGAIGAEVALIRWLGVTGSAWIAGLLDGSIAIAALYLSLHDSQPKLEPRAVTANVEMRSSRALLTSAWLAGATLLALEVVWFRFLSLFALTTTLALSVMLAVVLTGIGVGGLAASRWLAHHARAAAYLPAVALSAGCVVVGSYESFQWLAESSQVGDWHRILWSALVLTFPVSLLSGVIFTLLGERIARDVVSGTRAAAWLTLANTLGAMCGPLLTSFILLPALGMERTIFALALSYGVVALVAASALDAGMVAGRRVATMAALVLTGALVTFPFGLMRGTYFVRAAAAYGADGSEIVETREGASETIFLMRQTWMGRPVYDRLVTDGFSMSGTAVPAMRYMRDFIYLPMLLHKGPLRRVLVVCYGVGVTASAATDLPDATAIDVVEISRDVIAMSDSVSPIDPHPLHDPRVRLHIEDGRYFLQTTTGRFDLITGEPPPPRTPGAVNIYTRDYFHLILDRLAEGGIATYWLPVARPNPGTDVNTIIRAFCDVFSDCSLWNATPFDLMLVGTHGAEGPVPMSQFARAWSTPRLADKLREAGFEQPEQMGATFVGDASFLRQLTADTPPLTDDYPQRLRPTPSRASLSDPRYGVDPAVARVYQQVIDPTRARQAFASSDLVRRLFPAELVARTLPFFDQQRMVNQVLWEGGKPLRLIEDLDAVLAHTTLRTLPLWMLGSDDVKQGIASIADDGTGAAEYARGLHRLAARDYPGAISEFAAAERRGFRGATERPLLVYALCRSQNIDDATRLASGIEPRDSDEMHFWRWMRIQCHL